MGLDVAGNLSDHGPIPTKVRGTRGAYLFAVRSARHIVALAALFASGCFLWHGDDPDPGPPPPPRRDAGPAPADAGPTPMCFDTEGAVGGFACPGAIFSPGDYVNIEVSHSVIGCCATGTGRVGVSNDSPGEWYLESYWTDVCECCDECECIGPSDTTTVAIGPLADGVNVVHGDGFSCEIFAGRVAERCESVPASARTARVLFPDQTDDVTFDHVASADCGCAPRVSVGFDELVDFALCECTESCDDVLTAYQGHHVGETRPVGEYSRTLAGTPSPLSVRDPATCRPLEALDLEVALPAHGTRTAGPPLAWVGVSGEEWLCCAEPAPAVRSERAPDGVIDLTLFSCVQEDCACLPDAPTSFTAWHSLGALPPGEYRLRAGAASARFAVP